MSAADRIGGRRVLIIAALAVAVVIGYVASQSLQSAAVYYYTPTEAKQHGFAVGQTVRLGGQVLPGTLTYDPGARALRFTVGDGITTVRVVGSGAPPGLLREGNGAVIEGSFAADGTFRATQVIAKHDEVYTAPTGSAVPTHQTPAP
ncbi:MAG TPA: cytochrome c maturation protein CcmE [Candidatus Limnocylindria bacterium]|nr:cytochrome c maturation protein CcmE [Candidatus Limnocylindria bacterium]